MGALIIAAAIFLLPLATTVSQVASRMRRDSGSSLRFTREWVHGGDFSLPLA